MIGQPRYYSRDYGWCVLEHSHVITLTHLKDGFSMFQCACGYDYVGQDRVIRAQITAHRMEEFPIVRDRLVG